MDDKQYRETAKAAVDSFAKDSPFAAKKQAADKQADDEKQARRAEKWERLVQQSQNIPERGETNYLTVEVADMIEDRESDPRIMIHLLIQLAREQARTASALEDIRDLLARTMGQGVTDDD